MAEIALPCGRKTVIDDEDAALCSEYSWYSTGTLRNYVTGRRHGSLKMVYLHRLLSGAGAGEEADHFNHDTLDNRRGNLRVVGRVSNAAWNRRRGGVSGFKGVKLDGRTGRYVARLAQQKTSRHLGVFDTAEDAARAYDKAAMAAYGGFASLNFPETSHGHV